MSLEHQRYGRNKATLVNKAYINNGEYRNKFDAITNNITVRRVLYAKAKEMLLHRSGTMLEDMYWIDGETGDVVASVLNETIESMVRYPDSVKRAIKGKNNLIAMHTHLHSMPPSIEDFNSAFVHKYKTGIVLCHDGTLYIYISNQEIPVRLQRLYMEEFIIKGYNEKEAQLRSLEILKQNYNIVFWEVK